jgi:hypothetical protein
MWLERFWGWLRPFFTPAPAETRRPKADSQAGRYVRSFLFLRFMIGLLGILLPLAVVTLDLGIFDGHPGSRIPRGSISAYYYSGFREVFTVTIGTIAFFLFAYKITEKNLDNLLSVVAGLAGMLIPLFPTGIPPDINPAPKPTKIQHGVGIHLTQVIHFSASGVFIAFLGGICVLFGLREARRPSHGNWVSGRSWRAFHFLCAFAIAVAGGWILLTAVFHVIHGPYYSVLLGEWVSASAFGASWFVKGAEIHYLFFGRDEPAPQAPGPPPDDDASS